MAGDVRQPAVGQADRRTMPPCGPSEQPPRISQPTSGASTGASVGWSNSRRKRARTSRRSGPASPVAIAGVGTRCVTTVRPGLQQKRGDGGRTQHQPMASAGCRDRRPGNDGDGQVGADDEALPARYSWACSPAAGVAALGHDDQQRLGQRMVRLTRSPPGQHRPGIGVRVRSAWTAMRRRISSSRSARCARLTEPRSDGPGKPDRGGNERIGQERAWIGLPRGSASGLR